MTLRRIALWLALTLIPAVTKGQSCTASGVNRSCNVLIATPNTTTLTISSTAITLTASTNALTFAPTAADLTAGYTSDQPVTFTVSGNANWVLSVRGAAATWSSPAGAPRAKPIGDLLWAMSSGGTGTAMTTSNTQFATGTPGSATDPGHSITLYFRAFVTWAANPATGAGMAYPGSYSTSLTFTLTAQ
jgi:hypothetical protein